MTDEKILYNSKVVLIHFVLAIVFLGLLIFVVIEAPKPAGLIFTSILIAIGGQVQYTFIKNFIRLITKKPALELTQTNYIDHQNGIRIKWLDIKNVNSFAFGQWEFISFELRDNKIIFRQIQNPIHNILVRLESILTKTPFKTNITFVSGDNSELFWKVYYTHKDRITHIVAV